MVHIGVVGAGGMGTVHMSNYAHMEGCQVVALCDAVPAVEKAEAFGVPFFGSIADMLAQADVDVVDICTPTFMHKQHVEEALGAGKHVICEKPLALSAADGRALFALAKAKGVRLFVAHVVRFDPASLHLRKLVQSGEYGRMLDGEFLRLSACPRWVKNGWLFDKEKSGHIPFDLHIHDLDLIVSLWGKPDGFSFTACGNKGIGYKEHYRINYRFGDSNVSAQAAWYNADIPFTTSWRVYFENAVVQNDPNGMVAYQFDREPRVFDTEDRIKIPTGINVPPTGIYLKELSHFIDCIGENKDSDMFEESQLIAVLELLEEISKSST